VKITYQPIYQRMHLQTETNRNKMKTFQLD